MKLKILEKDVQKTIMDTLEYKHIFHWRNNSGAFKRDKSFYRFGDVGSPDIFMVIKGQIFGIECKSPTGKQSDSQIEWQERFEMAGGIYLLIKSLKDLEMLELI